MSRVITWAIGLIVVAMLLAAFLLPAGQIARESSRRVQAKNELDQVGAAVKEFAAVPFPDDQPAPASNDGVVIVPTESNRKIIYSANVQLVVEDFAGVPDKVAALVKKFDAYIADSNLAGSTGETRRGTWKVRVPVAKFEDFLNAAKGLGELVNVGTSSRDVSEEYYDVDARIRNKTKEEERLLKLLEERPGKLEDVIAIERELSRVREELERMQGRMRVLADLTSLTTVDVSIEEIHNYKPEDAATLTTRLRRAFDDSLSALGSTASNLLVAGAAVVPWLPVLAIGLALGYGVVRTQRRRD